MPKGEPQHLLKYGMKWPITLHAVEIEINCIQRGGKWRRGDGSEAGEGMFFHYKRLQQLLWPDEVHNRWTDLILSEILKNRITAIMGPKDSSKTHSMSKFGLTDYFCFPNNTLILISSTDIRGLELRVWGDLKTMFTKAKALVPWLPGHLLDSKHAITTDSLKEDKNRDLRKGVVCIPCMSSGGSWMGLGKYVGIKQTRRRLFGDELQFMKPSYIESLANLNSGDFKGVFVGNPLGEGDPLDKMAEPKDGWGTEGDVSATTVWENKFIEGHTINLVGTDSPNFDHSQDPEPKYPWMINRHSIEAVVAFYGMDSLQYYSQCLGIRRPGLNARRVISKMMCKKFGAFDAAIWLNTRRTKIYGLDAAYGGLGGDRCVGLQIEFGFDVNSKAILKVHAPDIVPVSVKDDVRLPEDQIASWVKQKCEGEGIPPSNVFYDATGRGSLGTSFARLWSAYVNPVEFGGRPTDRPVSTSLKVRDEESKQMRLKLCNEHYSKFVTELWFSVRYIIEAGQMRELPNDVMDEGCRREWKMVKGDKIEIESKEDMKERVNISPDLFDALCFEASTMILTEHGSIPISEVMPGMRVQTPFGFSTVVMMHSRIADDVVRVEFSDGKQLTGTSKHDIFTNQGWCPLDALGIDKEVETLSNLPLWQMANALFTRVRNTTFKAQVDITHVAKKEVSMSDFFIGLYGSTIVEKFRRAFAFITKMVTGKITDCEIWRPLRKVNTPGSTCLKGWNSSNGLFVKLLPLVEYKLQSGTALKRELSGIKSMEEILGDEESLSVSFAASVPNPSWPTLSELDSVPKVANLKQRANAVLMCFDGAMCVVKLLLRIATGKRGTVRAIARQLLPQSRKVYDLTLEDHNVYYANGILVSNCTAIEGARRMGFVISSLDTGKVKQDDDGWKKILQDRAKNLRKNHELSYS